MSTRANFHLITKQGLHKFQSNSSAYPSEMLPKIFRLVQSCEFNTKDFGEPDSLGLSDLFDGCGLTLGSIGNFSYVYELNFINKTLRVWNNKFRWVNAPNDWQERGWNCWVGGKNNTYGYTNWIKGKLLVSLKFDQMLTLTHEIDMVVLKYAIDKDE